MKRREVPDRQICLEDQPRPFVTPEGMAAQYRPVGEDAVDPVRPARLRPLRRNPLLDLLADGIITAKQAKAGQEISRVYAAITASVMPRVSANYGERIGGVADDDLPVPLRLAVTNRYGPWRTWAGGLAVTPAKSLADLTLLVCVDELGLRQAASAVRMDQRTVKRRIQDSLHWYCRHAGWIDARGA